MRYYTSGEHYPPFEQLAPVVLFQVISVRPECDFEIFIAEAINNKMPMNSCTIFWTEYTLNFFCLQKVLEQQRPSLQGSLEVFYIARYVTEGGVKEK